MELWKEELYHHGILGQKWGIRRFQNPDGTRTAAGKKRRNEYDDIKNLSDDDLNKRLNRAKLEQRYNNLTSKKTNKTLDVIGKAATVATNTGNMANSGGQLAGIKKISKVGNVVNQSGNAIQAVKNSSKTFSNKKKSGVDISKMSDADLKKMVDRLDKEKQLREIEESTRKTGSNYVETILDYAGAVTAIGAGALGIALAIKQLSKKG